MLLLGCAKPAPSWVSRGALVLAPEALGCGASAAQVSAVVATEVEAVKGGAAAGAIVERLGLQRSSDFAGRDAAAVVRAALACARRGESLVLDVSATASRPELARSLCDAALEVSVFRRLDAKQAARSSRAAQVGARLDALPADAGPAAALRAELDELSAPTLQADERVFEPCAAPTRTP